MLLGATSVLAAPSAMCRSQMMATGMLPPTTSLRAASAREVGQLPLVVLGLALTAAGVFWQHGDLRADDEGNADVRPVPPARTLRAQSYTDCV